MDNNPVTFETTRREESIRPQGPETSIDMEVANLVHVHPPKYGRIGFDSYSYILVDESNMAYWTIQPFSYFSSMTFLFSNLHKLGISQLAIFDCRRIPWLIHHSSNHQTHKSPVIVSPVRLVFDV